MIYLFFFGGGGGGGGGRGEDQDISPLTGFPPSEKMFLYDIIHVHTLKPYKIHVDAYQEPIVACTL